MVFIDRVDELHPARHLGRIEATNPCGEVPLLPFEACNLGSIDLGRFVTAGGFAWERLRHDDPSMPSGFLHDVIDANRYPLPDIERATKATRKVGLGVMGWADALIALDIAYDDPAALALADRVATFLEDEVARCFARACRAARSIPSVGGVALASGRTAAPAQCHHHDDRSDRDDQHHRQGARAGSSRSTRLPTGATCSTAPSSSRSARRFCGSQPRGGSRVMSCSPRSASTVVCAGLPRSQPMCSAGSPPRMTSTWRRTCAHAGGLGSVVPIAAVSKTINLRRNAAAADVKAAYQLAYELGCKGITVYRDGSRDGQVLVTGARSVAAAPAAGCPECGAALLVQERLSAVPELRLVGLRLRRSNRTVRSSSRRSASARPGPS